VAFILDFTIPSKHAPWGGDQGDKEFFYWARDLSAATFKWVFYDPADRSVKMTLDTAAEGSEGIFAEWFAGIVNPETGVAEGHTRIVPQINETTLEGLTYSGVSDLVLDHTLYITPSGMLQFPFCKGTVTIEQGAPD